VRGIFCYVKQSRLRTTLSPQTPGEKIDIKKESSGRRRFENLQELALGSHTFQNVRTGTLFLSYVKF
jgi:hypothetical protein